MENFRPETAERTEVNNPEHNSEEEQSKQECSTRRNSGVQGYNTGDGHRKMDKRSPRHNCLFNGLSIAEDYHETGIDKDAYSNKGPDNGRHSAADDR